MKEVILTVGCPGSGKTTWAKEYARTNSGVIFNRDDMRLSMFGFDARNEYKYTKAREKSVTSSQFASALATLSIEGVKCLIVADTNLNSSTRQKWKDFCDEHGFKLTEVPFHEPLHVLFERNFHRGKDAVPLQVIRDMYQKMRTYMGEEIKFNRELPKAIIYDLDGTLALNDHRSPYDLEKLSDDAPNTMVIQHLWAMQAQGYKIITCSGRESGTKDEPLKYKVSTLDWLRDQGIHTDAHYQRRQGDSRKDAIVKRELLTMISTEYYPVLAVDDRTQVVEMWRSVGIECWQVNTGDF